MVFGVFFWRKPKTNNLCNLCNLCNLWIKYLWTKTTQLKTYQQNTLDVLRRFFERCRLTDVKDVYNNVFLLLEVRWEKTALHFWRKPDSSVFAWLALGLRSFCNGL